MTPLMRRPAPRSLALYTVRVRSYSAATRSGRRPRRYLEERRRIDLANAVSRIRSSACCRWFSTGNASPDDDGAVRPGANLFSVPIVAFDIKTGKLRIWYYQMVHTDRQDYDAPARPCCSTRPSTRSSSSTASAGAQKAGQQLYLLDRTNVGRSIKCRPTQYREETDQATLSDTAVPVAAAADGDPSTHPPIKSAEIQKRANGVPMAIAKRPFTPYKPLMMVTAPGRPAAGAGRRRATIGMTHRFACVPGRTASPNMTAGNAPGPSPKGGAAAGHDVGSIWTVGGPNAGYFDAVDVVTQEDRVAAAPRRALATRVRS